MSDEEVAKLYEDAVNADALFVSYKEAFLAGAQYKESEIDQLKKQLEIYRKIAREHDQTCLKRLR